MIKKSGILRKFLTIIFIFSVYYLFSTSVYLFPDGQYYFSYLPTLYYDNDIHFYNNFINLKPPLPIVLTNTGYISNIGSFGTAFFWIPFYLIGKYLLYLNNGSFPMPNSGWLWSFVNFGTMVYVLFSIFLVYDLIVFLEEKNLSQIIRKKNTLDKQNLKNKKIKIVLFPALYLFATPLFFYGFIMPCTSHGISAFIVTLFIWFWIRTIDKSENLRRYIILGIIAGFMALVRPQEIIFAVCLVFEWLLKLIYKKNFKNIVKQILVFSVFVLIGFSPQMLLWKFLYSGFFNAPASFNVSIKYFSLVEILFSSYHGILFWTPIYFVSIIGLFIALKRNFLVSIGLLISILLQILLNSCCLAFWEGYSFGLRQMTSSAVIVGVGCYFILVHLNNKVLKNFFNVVIYLCLIWTLLLTMNAYTGLNLLEYISPKELFQSQMKIMDIILNTIKKLFQLKVDIAAVIIFTLISFILIYVFKKIYEQLEKVRSFIIFVFIFVIFYINFKIFFAHKNKPLLDKEFFQICMTQVEHEKYLYDQAMFYRNDYENKKKKIK